jgi:hypothetical protein
MEVGRPAAKGGVTSMAIRNLIWTVAAIAAAACDGTAVTDSFQVLADVEGPRPIAGFSPTCPSWSCPGNAGTIGDGIVFDGLDLSSVHGEVKIDRVEVRPRVGATYPSELQVARDVLMAKARSGAVIPAHHLTAEGSGQALVIILKHGADRYELELRHANQVNFWAQPVSGTVMGYRFTVFKLTRGPFQKRISPGSDLCRGEQLESNGWGGVEYHALAFAGDFFDKATVRVEAPPSPSWFNLACAGTAMAKMHLLRHTEASSNPGGMPPQLTTRAQRTAMLKMLTADYCGTGRRFTQDGHPLLWKDVNGWYTSRGFPIGLSTVPASQIEAIWSADGATCMNTPRLADSGWAPEVTRDVVLANCPGPFTIWFGPYPLLLPPVHRRCDEAVAQWPAGGHVISLHPSRP